MTLETLRDLIGFVLAVAAFGWIIQRIAIRIGMTTEERIR